MDSSQTLLEHAKERERYLAELRSLAMPDASSLSDIDNCRHRLEEGLRLCETQEERARLSSVLIILESAALFYNITLPLQLVCDRICLEAIPLLAKAEVNQSFPSDSLERHNPLHKVNRKDIFSLLHIYDERKAQELIRTIRCDIQVTDDLIEAYEANDEATFSTILRDKTCDYSVLASYLYYASQAMLFKEFPKMVGGPLPKDIPGLEGKTIPDKLLSLIMGGEQVFRQSEIEEGGDDYTDDLLTAFGQLKQAIESNLDEQKITDSIQTAYDVLFAMTVDSYMNFDYSPEEAEIIESITSKEEYHILYERCEGRLNRMKQVNIPVSQDNTRPVKTTKTEAEDLRDMELHWPTDEEMEGYEINRNSSEYFTESLFGVAPNIKASDVERLYICLTNPKLRVLEDNLETKLILLSRYSGKIIPHLEVKQLEWKYLDEKDRDKALGFLINKTGNAKYAKGMKFFYYLDRDGNITQFIREPVSQGGLAWADPNRQDRTRRLIENLLNQFIEEYTGQNNK